MLRCSICNQSFDTTHKKPLILPQCGHTYCQQCIQQQIDINNIFLCPQDKKKYLDITSLDMFPTNEMIMSLLKDQHEICKIHQKPLEYFCLEEKMDICSLCALFGGHNSHTKQIITQQQLEIQTQTIQKDLEENLKKITLGQKDKTFKNYMDSKLQKTLYNKKQEFMKFYHHIKNEIRKFIAEKWEKYEKNLQYYLEKQIYNNEKGEFSKIQNFCQEIKEKIGSSEFKSLKLGKKYSETINMTEKIEKFKNLFYHMSDLCSKIEQSTFNLDFDNNMDDFIKIKFPQFLEFEDNVEESQLLQQTLPDFGNNTEFYQLLNSSSLYDKSNEISLLKDKPNKLELPSDMNTENISQNQFISAKNLPINHSKKNLSPIKPKSYVSLGGQRFQRSTSAMNNIDHHDSRNKSINDKQQEEKIIRGRGERQKSKGILRMLSPLDKKMNFIKNEQQQQQLKNKVDFKNITIDVATMKKILSTVISDHEGIERLNFRKIHFKGKILQTIFEYFKIPLKKPLTIDIRQNNIKLEQNEYTGVKKLKKMNVKLLIQNNQYLKLKSFFIQQQNQQCKQKIRIIFQRKKLMKMKIFIIKCQKMLLKIKWKKFYQKKKFYLKKNKFQKKEKNQRK